MNRKEQQAQRAKQEDEILNKVLWWIVGSVILEMLLLLLNKVYVNYTVDQIELAYSLRGVFQVLAIVLPICFVVMLALWLAARKAGHLVRLAGGLTLVFLVLAVCAVVIRIFDNSGVKFLYLAVPAVAVLALIYYLYQREFFFSALLSALGLLGIKLLPRIKGASVIGYGYAVALAVIVVAALVVFRMLQKNEGKLSVKGKLTRILPKNANYALLYVTCGVVAVAAIAAVVLGGLTVLYGVLVAWLLILAVYYTVRLM